MPCVDKYWLGSEDLEITGLERPLALELRGCHSERLQVEPGGAPKSGASPSILAPNKAQRLAHFLCETVAQYGAHALASENWHERLPESEDF